MRRPPAARSRWRGSTGPDGLPGDGRKGANRGHRRGGGPPRDRRLLRRARARGLRAGHRRREGGRPAAGRGDDPRARPSGARLEKRRAASLHHLAPRGGRASRASVLLRRHPADLLRRRGPLARGGGARGARRRQPPRAGHEEHGAGRDRARDRAAPPGARLRVEPRVPQGGHRDPGLLASGPGGGGRERRLGPLRRPRAGPLRAVRGAGHPHRRGQRRDDQARVERLPGHQDLVHQRDRERLRGGGGRRRGGRSRDGPRRADRAEVPAPGRRVWRQLLPEGRPGPQAAGRQHRLPLPAPDRGHRGQRAAEAADDRQAPEALGVARRQAHRTAWRGVQAGHRRHPRGHQPRARRAVAERGGAGEGLRSGRRGPGPRAARRGRDPLERARRPGRGARRRARYRVARVPRARLGRRGQAADGGPARGRRAQLPRPGRARRRRLHLRGDRTMTQALLLAGGEGTRLRPLTYTVPKPVMPLAGRPFLSFMLDWLGRHGVDEAILSCGFLSEGVRRVLGDIYDGMRVRYVVESEPLGTAGPVRLAYDEGLLAERLVVLNGDVLTDIDLSDQLAEHERTGAAATLALVAVDDAEGYWIDIGTPERYLEATYDLLSARVESNLPPRDETGSLVYEGCVTGGAHIGPQTVLGRHCAVGTDTRIERSVLHDRVLVGADSLIRESVLAERVRIGERAQVEPGAVVGAGATIGDEAFVDGGARVEPGTRIE